MARLLVTDVDIDFDHHPGPELAVLLINRNSNGKPLRNLGEITTRVRTWQQGEFCRRRIADRNDMPDEIRLGTAIIRRVDAKQTQNSVHHPRTWISIDRNLDPLPDTQFANLCFFHVRFNPDGLRVMHQHQALPGGYVFAHINECLVYDTGYRRPDVPVGEVQFLPRKLGT